MHTHPQTQSECCCFALLLSFHYTDPNTATSNYSTWTNCPKLPNFPLSFFLVTALPRVENGCRAVFGHAPRRLRQPAYFPGASCCGPLEDAVTVRVCRYTWQPLCRGLKIYASSRERQRRATYLDQSDTSVARTWCFTDTVCVCVTFKSICSCCGVLCFDSDVPGAGGEHFWRRDSRGNFLWKKKKKN